MGEGAVNGKISLKRPADPVELTYALFAKTRAAHEAPDRRGGPLPSSKKHAGRSVASAWQIALDREQFAQLIGYSVGGFAELEYVSERTHNAAKKTGTGL